MKKERKIIITSIHTQTLKETKRKDLLVLASATELSMVYRYSSYQTQTQIELKSD